jgi:hypothetical protein
MRLLADKPLVRCAHLCLLLVMGASACSVSDGVLGIIAGGDGLPVTSDGGITSDGGVSVATCPLTSPRVTIATHDTCSGRLAASRFSNALCTCGNLQLSNSLSTHGFDSRQGPYQVGQPDDSGAAVGVNGNYSLLAGATTVGGSFSIAGGGDLQLVGQLQSRGDFYCAGNILVAGPATVSRNAWLGGNFSGLGALTVDGDCHHVGLLTALPVSVAGTNQRQPVIVAKPCPCAPSDLLDISALVDAAKVKNDNDSFGLPGDRLASVAGADQWTLSCGRIYLSQISGVGNLVIHVTGMVALFIDGSINLVGSLSFDVASGAEIDVFVKGDLNVQGALSLASKDRPAAGRLWVGGKNAITLPSPWIGNLYAPQAHVSATVGLEVWGSIFVGDFAGGAYASFIFDRAVLAAGTNCEAPRPPAGVCNQCQWCSGGAACVAESCGPCQTDGDCCSLSSCSNGSCVPLLEAGGTS